MARRTRDGAGAPVTERLVGLSGNRATGVSLNVRLIERPGGSRAVDVRSPVLDCSTGPFDDAFRVPKKGRFTVTVINQNRFRRVFGTP